MPYNKNSLGKIGNLEERRDFAERCRRQFLIQHTKNPTIPFFSAEDCKARWKNVPVNYLKQKTRNWFGSIDTASKKTFVSTPTIFGANEDIN